MEDGREREIIKIASDAHETGYFTGYRDTMEPGQVEYVEDGPDNQPPQKTVYMIRCEMDEQGIEIPKGMKKKADLLKHQADWLAEHEGEQTETE